MRRQRLIFTAFLLALLGIFAPAALAADISVPMTKQSPAALFDFNGFTWIVVKDKVPVDIDLLKKTAGNSATQIIEIPHKSATVLRIKPAANISFYPRRSGNLFIAEATTKKPNKTTAYNAKIVRPANSSSRIFIEAKGLFAPITFTDPASGFAIDVLTSIDGKGLSSPLAFPEVMLAKSAQGIAVIPLADNIETALTPTGASIFKIGKDIIADPVMPMQNDIATTDEGILDLKNWGYAPEESFKNAYKKALLLPIMASPENINEARLATARFFLANELYPEALGAVAKMEKADKKWQSDNAVLAIKGTANLMLKRKQTAAALLAKITPANDAYRNLWLAAATNDLNGILNYVYIIKTYPEPLKNTLVFMALDLADETANERALGILLALTESPDSAYYKGRQNELLKAYSAARNEYKTALSSASGKVATKAAYRLARLDLKTDIKPLDSAAKIRDLLNIYNNVAKAYPHTKIASDAARQASNLFAALYLQGKANLLSKIDAALIFDEYQNLIPATKKGYEMRLNYVDRLVALDLLDMAQKSLENLFKNPFADSRDLHLRLAVIYGLQGNKAKANSALNRITPNARNAIFHTVKHGINDDKNIAFPLGKLALSQNINTMADYSKLDKDMQNIAAFKTLLKDRIAALEPSVFIP